jgi:hypothetical protein
MSDTLRPVSSLTRRPVEDRPVPDRLEGRPLRGGEELLHVLDAEEVGEPLLDLGGLDLQEGVRRDVPLLQEELVEAPDRRQLPDHRRLLVVLLPEVREVLADLQRRDLSRMDRAPVAGGEPDELVKVLLVRADRLGRHVPLVPQVVDEGLFVVDRRHCVFHGSRRPPVG